MQLSNYELLMQLCNQQITTTECRVHINYNILLWKHSSL